MPGSNFSTTAWNLRSISRALAADRALEMPSVPQAAAFNSHRVAITTGVRRAAKRKYLGYKEKLHCASKSPGQGKTNGMPWDGTSSIKVSTHVEIVPARKPEKGLEALLVRLWAMPMPGERNAALWALAEELRPYSAEVAEDVRMLCGMIWQGIGS